MTAPLPGFLPRFAGHLAACSAALALLAVGGLPSATAEETPQEGGRLSPEEIADIAGDLPARGGERDSFGQRITEVLALEAVSPRGVPADRVDVPYGDHARMALDFWRADAGGPSPVALFLHGGGFRRGDKALLRDSRLLDQLLEAGISVAGVNYRYSHQHPDGTAGSLRDIARAVQHLRHHAADFGIDPDRVAAFGGSAGGAASLWLAFREDLADPESDDPVARESTRIRCAGAMATPSTMDLLQWPEILGIDEEALARAARSFGVADLASLSAPGAASARAEIDIVALMSPGDPPFFIHNNDPGGIPVGVGEMAHHPNHARVLMERAREIDVEAVAFAPGIGIEHPSGENLVAFFTRHLLSGEDQE